MMSFFKKLKEVTIKWPKKPTKWQGTPKGQWYLWASLVGCGSLLGGSICYWTFRTEETVKPDRSYKTNLTGGRERMDHKKIWAHKMNQDHEELTKRLERIEQAMKASETSSFIDTEIQPTSMSTQPIVETSFSQVTPPLSVSQTPLNPTPPTGQVNPSSSSPSGVAPSVGTPSMGTPLDTAITPSPTPQSEKKRLHTSGIQKTSLKLPTRKTLKTGDNTLPAGAFAEAILLGGVDASTSIQASSDPRPVLLRLTNPGTLPRRFKSDLCGCHVLAACYGDISSERVFMRLEKITCTERKTGEIVEMNVKGYVAGEDGRAGLRGTVVDRAGESVRNAAVGGFIGGIAGFIGQANQNPVTYSLSSGLAQSPSLKGSDVLKQGAAKGAGNALEKYADFYIKRAEQMQPVIQVQAGRIVDIVLTESTRFEDSAERRSLIHINDRQRYEQIGVPAAMSNNVLTSNAPTNNVPTNEEPHTNDKEGASQ